MIQSQENIQSDESIERRTDSILYEPLWLLLISSYQFYLKCHSLAWMFSQAYYVKDGGFSTKESPSFYD